MKQLLAIAAICAAPCAVAQEARPDPGVSGRAEDTRPLLWNGLRVGMSKDEVKRLLPKRLVPLGNGCHIVAYARFGTRGLDRIDMEWSLKDDATKRCGILVRQTLLEKYGEPDISDREIKSNDCGNSYAGGLAGALSNLCRASGGEEPDHFELSRWNTEDGIELTFKIDAKADDPKWWAVYRMAPVADEDMKAKF